MNSLGGAFFALALVLALALAFAFAFALAFALLILFLCKPAEPPCRIHRAHHSIVRYAPCLICWVLIGWHIFTRALAPALR